MKEDVGIVITNNYNIAVNFEPSGDRSYCKQNRIVITYLIKIL